MRFPLAIVLAAQITSVSALAAPAELSPGKPVSRWSIKTSVPAGVSLAKPGIRIDLDSFLRLKPAAEQRTREFQEKRYPKVPGAPAGEGDIVRTQGFIRLVAQEADGDFHIQVTTAPDNFDNCLVVEAPMADREFIAHSPALIPVARTVRDFVTSRLLAGATPKPGSVHVMKRQAFVEVTGQLFFDSEHQAGMAHGQFRGKSIHGQKLPSKTSWEIHPITAMRFVPAPTN